MFSRSADIYSHKDCADDEYRLAFTRAGLAVEHDPEGLTGRGLSIGCLV